MRIGYNRFLGREVYNNMGNFYEILGRECSSPLQEYIDKLHASYWNAKTYDTYFVPTIGTTDDKKIELRNINYNCASTDEQAENYN